jgi:hypothetical protein
MALAEELLSTVNSKIRKHTLEIHHSLEILDYKAEYSMYSPMHLFKQEIVHFCTISDSKEEWASCKLMETST